MKNKILTAFIIFAGLFSSCHKNTTSAVDPALTAHYLFKTGTYWVYGGSVLDSMYVVATGTQNGQPYMKINETVMNTHDSIIKTATIYIGVGPAGNQLQLWGYNYGGNSTPQVIFEADTPILGTYIGTGCQYSGMDVMDGISPSGLYGDFFVTYSVEYSKSNKNQVYGNVIYYFYPDWGIVQINSYANPWGDQWLNLIRHHIIH
jgi:hypothetical protein